MSVLPRSIEREQITDSRIELNSRWIEIGSVNSARSRRAALNPSGFEVMIGVLIALLVVGCVGIYFDHQDWVEARRRSRESYTAAIAGAGKGLSSKILHARPMNRDEGH